MELQKVADEYSRRTGIVNATNLLGYMVCVCCYGFMVLRTQVEKSFITGGAIYYAAMFGITVYGPIYLLDKVNL